MPLTDINMCRLCMNTELLQDLYSIDGETTLSAKTNACIDINAQPGDGLPAAICEACIRKINEFYSFKKKCKEVDSKLKTISNDFEHSFDNMEIIPEDKPDLMANNTNLETEITNEMVKHTETNKIIKKPNSTYQCELCGRIFKMKAVLETHLIIHSGIKPYICKICPKRFARAENRMIHMRSHMGIKPYVCEICGSSSTKRQDLIRHMKIHSDERNYSCPRCDRQFKRSSDVISHMRTHTGLRPYRCHTCDKTYTSHSGLRKHNKIHCRNK